MSNLRILPLSLADAPTMYATSEETLFAITNMQGSQPSKKWRSTSAVDQEIWSKFDTSSACSGFTLYQHNMSPDGMLRLALYARKKTNTITGVSETAGVVTITTNTAHGLDDTISNGVWIENTLGFTDLNLHMFDVLAVPTTDTFTITLTSGQSWTSGGDIELCETVYDDTSVAFDPRYGLGESPLGLDGMGGFAILGNDPTAKTIWFDSVTATHMLVELFDSDNSDGYLEAGRLMIENRWEPDVNFNFGATFGYKDDTVAYRSRGGAVHTNDKPSYRTFTCTLEWLNDLDSIELHDVLGLVGKRGDIFLSAFPDVDQAVSGATEIYGKIISYSPITKRSYGYGIDINIEENL